MRKHILELSGWAIVLLCGMSQAEGADVPQFRELFNGKDLSGWVNVNTAADTWSVRDGLLVLIGLVLRKRRRRADPMAT